MLFIGLWPAMRAPRRAASKRRLASASEYSAPSLRRLDLIFAMPDPKSRARVVRLLTGEFRPDDLTGLFLYARDHCDGRETVADIGNFVAHHDERDKGIVTRSTREWFAVARYHMPRFAPGGPYPLHAKALPPAAQEYFKIAVNRVGAQLIRKKTGLRGAQAYKIMQDLALRLIRNEDRTWSLPANCTATELSLVECVSSHLVVEPAFDADRLSEDFIATLKSNDLITKDELRTHKEGLTQLVQAYAVAAMHNCIVQVGDGTTTQLLAKPNLNDRKIDVLASVPDAVPKAPKVSIAAAMFSANIDPHVCCHPDLLTKVWDFEVELGPDKRLSRLG